MEKKTDLMRLEELALALRAIEFSREQFFKDGDDMHFLAIKSQLRALVCTGGRNMKPLLLDLADQYNIPLYIHSFNDIQVQDLATLVADMPASPSWTVKPLGQRFTFREWLNVPTYYSPITKGYVSRNKILRQITDGNAAHYDEAIGELVTFIEAQTYGKTFLDSNGQPFDVSENGLRVFLMDIVYATCWLGNIFLCTVNNELGKIEHYNRQYEKAIDAMSTKRYRMVFLNTNGQNDAETKKPGD